MLLRIFSFPSSLYIHSSFGLYFLNSLQFPFAFLSLSCSRIPDFFTIFFSTLLNTIFLCFLSFPEVFLWTFVQHYGIFANLFCYCFQFFGILFKTLLFLFKIVVPILFCYTIQSSATNHSVSNAFKALSSLKVPYDIIFV